MIPWLFFAGFFAAHGAAPAGFLGALFANGAAGGFAADVLISLLVFWVLSFTDARENRVAS